MRRAAGCDIEALALSRDVVRHTVAAGDGDHWHSALSVGTARAMARRVNRIVAPNRAESATS